MQLRITLLAMLAAAASAQAQQPTVPPKPARPDSAQRADSIEKARQDSIALVRELEGSAAPGATSAEAPSVQTGAPANPRLMPDLSFIGDLLADASPRRSSQEDSARAGIREVEMAASAAVDPYFRVDFVLSMSDAERISIEEAYASTTALPWQTQLRLGRFYTPFGKQNTTHRGELHTTEYPWVLQRFFSPDALKGTGLYASRYFAPFGFYQELILTATDRFGEAPADLTTARGMNRGLGGLAYTARLRNYVDLSESTNLELSGSALTGRREQPIAGATLPDDVNAVGARQSVFGTDLTFRWRPLQRALYRSFILQSEFLYQRNERDPAVPTGTVYAGPHRNFTGMYAFSRYQLTQRLFLGGRYDQLQDPERDGARLVAGSGDLEYFPSEFSKLVLTYERLMPEAMRATDRVLLQATFSIGPHRPHPF